MTTAPVCPPRDPLRSSGAIAAPPCPREGMAAHVMVVFTNPVPGREDEYNDWYNNVPLGEVLRTPGMTCARRYRLVDGVGSREEPQHRYLAIYELDSEDIKSTLKQMLGMPMN